MIRNTIICLSLLCVHTVYAGDFGTSIVDFVAIEESKSSFSSRIQSKYILPKVSSSVKEEIEGAFVGLLPLEYRLQYCNSVDEILHSKDVSVINMKLNLLSDIEKSWAFVEVFNVPMQCVAFITQGEGTQPENTAVVTLSPNGDFLWTRDEKNSVLAWAEIGSTPYQFISLWFLGELYVVGIE